MIAFTPHILSVFTPHLLCLFGAAITLIFFYQSRLQKKLSVVISFLYLIVATYFSFFFDLARLPELQVGNWPKEIAIGLGIDPFSALMLFVTGVVYFATCVYSVLGSTAENSRYYFPLLHILIFGISGAFVTRDLFNLYVWFEVSLLSSFVLISLEANKLRLAGALKYVIINIFSSLLFLTSVGLIYGSTHSLHFDSLSRNLTALAVNHEVYVTTLGLLLFSAFAIKSALFPFCAWLPASYHTASPALSGLFAGMLTKLGLYAIFRVLTLVFPASEYFANLVLVIAPLTMILGVFGAIIQQHIRRILSFHIISQVGYIALAAAFASSPEANIRAAGLAAAIFYMVHHIVVKTNLFFVSGIIHNLYQSEYLEEVAGVRRLFPWLAVLFAIPAMSLVGLPPSSGFWSKLVLFKVSLQDGKFVAALAMVVAGFFTLYSMAKIWIGAFWTEDDSRVPISNKAPVASVFACFFLCAVSLWIAFWPDPLMRRSMQAYESSNEVASGEPRQ